MDKFVFTAWLHAERESRGWRKSDLARHAGLSQGYVGNLESGEREPTNDALKALAGAFNLDPDWLIAQVDTERIGEEGIMRLRKHATEFLLPEDQDERRRYIQGLFEEAVASRPEEPPKGTLARVKTKAARQQSVAFGRPAPTPVEGTPAAASTDAPVQPRKDKS